MHAAWRGTHLERGDLLAAAVDELLDAPSQGEVTLLVQESLVARVEPATLRSTRSSQPSESQRCHQSYQGALVTIWLYQPDSLYCGQGSAEE
jgi:hypothetical protein